jgi:hypothetical protein
LYVSPPSSERKPMAFSAGTRLGLALMKAERDVRASTVHPNSMYILFTAFQSVGMVFSYSRSEIVKPDTMKASDHMTNISHQSLLISSLP